MRVFLVGDERFAELDAIPAALPAKGFVWIAVARDQLTRVLEPIQQGLQRLAGGPLVDLHVSDLRNEQLPSRFDYTSWYDLLVFRRRVAEHGGEPASADDELALSGQRAVLHAIETSPVGFAIFDRVLVSVHPADCPLREHFVQRLTAGQAKDAQASRLPTSPADLMLRMVHHMVDDYLGLRRQLTRQLASLQQELLDTRSHFKDWQVLLDARNALHLLEDTCEDQSGAMQDWTDALEEWPPSADAHAAREHELLSVRSRDVVEHIDRVLAHVRRLQQSIETSVQMHFSALGHRTNAIMRTLTVLTAIFLPLNLITGIFGMNFDALPLIHSATGVWVALALMALIAIVLGAFFWRKRYLGTRR